MDGSSLDCIELEANISAETELEANISAETVWATISLKDQRKLVVGSYYRPPDSGSDSIDDLESVLSFGNIEFEKKKILTKTSNNTERSAL